MEIEKPKNKFNDSLLKGPPIENFAPQPNHLFNRNMKKAKLALLLSFSIFFKFPTSHIFIPKKRTTVRIVAWVEWILGLIMMALLLMSLSRTVPLLHELVNKLLPV